VWVVGKRARVPGGMYKYFIGGDCMYSMSVGGNGREISTTVNMGLKLNGWGA
jgi:hypothetical protein